MGRKFITQSNPMLTVMLQCETPEVAIGRIRNANQLGADAYGLQVEAMKPEYHVPKIYQQLFGQMKGRPCYATNYRTRFNAGLSDEELADGLITLAESGATLCDVMGDMFCKHPEELTDNLTAIASQMDLIHELHEAGAEVLMSTHLNKFVPAERVLEIAFEQKRRGADIVKIVSDAETMEQQIENLRITDLLKRELGAPFLFLSGGTHSYLHRTVGPALGVFSWLCFIEYDQTTYEGPPLLSDVLKLKQGLKL